MKSSFYGGLSVAIATLFLGSAVSAETVIQAFTGGDSGEGLDLSGNFAYAIDIDGGGRESAGFTVGDAVFTGDESTAGFRMTPVDRQDNAPAVYGDTANDDALESVMSTGAWVSGDDAVPDFALEMDVQTGQEYLLQLMFVEGWNASAPGIRQFNVVVEGETLATNFDITSVAGTQNVVDGVGESLAGAVVQHRFFAGDDVLNVALTHGAVDNPRFEALTVEIIPEPGSLVLMLTAALGLLSLRRRRRG
jgi:hypothetical protein